MYKAISKLLQGPLWLCGPSKAGVALLYLWEQLTRLTVWSVTSPQGRCLSFRGGKVCSTVPDVQICEVFLIPQVLMLTNLNSKKKVSGSWMLLTLTRLFGTCSVRTSTQLPLFVDGTCTSPHDHLVRFRLPRLESSSGRASDLGPASALWFAASGLGAVCSQLGLHSQTGDMLRKRSRKFCFALRCSCCWRVS